jgi:hypothetical protein
MKCDACAKGGFIQTHSPETSASRKEFVGVKKLACTCAFVPSWSQHASTVNGPWETFSLANSVLENCQSLTSRVEKEADVLASSTSSIALTVPGHEGMQVATGQGASLAGTRGPEQVLACDRALALALRAAVSETTRASTAMADASGVPKPELSAGARARVSVTFLRSGTRSSSGQAFHTASRCGSHWPGQRPSGRPSAPATACCGAAS